MLRGVAVSALKFVVVSLFVTATVYFVSKHAEGLAPIEALSASFMVGWPMNTSHEQPPDPVFHFTQITSPTPPNRILHTTACIVAHRHHRCLVEEELSAQNH